jgi:hypothetical protein
LPSSADLSLIWQFSFGEIGMAADLVHHREQRLRKQAELQSLYLNLANLRKQEVSYIEVSANIPELLLHQINETRQEIRAVEDELLALNDETIQTPGRQFYREAFDSELAGDFDKAIKLYKNASHYNHPDAGIAIRSVRYARKVARNKAAGKTWTPSTPTGRLRSRLLIGLAAALVLVSMGIFVISRYFLSPSETTATEPTATLTPPAVILIIPDTATPPPTLTQTPMATPTPTPTDTPSLILPVVPPTKTLTPTPVPTLKPAPRIIEPRDNLVWHAGAVVFEFQEMNLAEDELYCLNTLRGFDKTNTENWSFPPIGNEKPSIAIEANVIGVAKDSGMRCIVWSASIGKESCENIISQSTEERVIGLPQPCNFK